MRTKIIMIRVRMKENKYIINNNNNDDDLDDDDDDEDDDDEDDDDDDEGVDGSPILTLTWTHDDIQLMMQISQCDTITWCQTAKCVHHIYYIKYGRTLGRGKKTLHGVSV